MLKDSRLGILIEPSQVRLKTNSDDPYTWEIMEGKEHLFSKNMSDLSIGALKELYEGIDKSFAAIWKPSTCALRQVESSQENVCDVVFPSLVILLTLYIKYLHPVKPDFSFTAKIDELEECKTKLAHEISMWRNQAALELEKRQRAEEEVAQLKITIQETQKDNQKLEQHVQEWKLIAEQSRSSAAKYSRGLSKIWTLLEELK